MSSSRLDLRPLETRSLITLSRSFVSKMRFEIVSLTSNTRSAGFILSESLNRSRRSATGILDSNSRLLTLGPKIFKSRYTLSKQ